MPLESIKIDGFDYLVGTAGSLILCCPTCGEQHFRDEWKYFGIGPLGRWSWHKCYTCGAQMQPVRMDHLSAWCEFWARCAAYQQGYP